MKVNIFIEAQVTNLKKNRIIAPKEIFENINFTNDVNAKVSRSVGIYKFLIKFIFIENTSII